MPPRRFPASLIFSLCLALGISLLRDDPRTIVFNQPVSSQTWTLRQINPAVRIIAVSGLSANANVARDAAAGVKRFLLKPYTTETLLKALKELLTAGE